MPDPYQQTTQGTSQPGSPQPYGHGPELAAPKASGTSATFWGIILLVFGAWVLVNLGMTMTFAFSGADLDSLMPGMDGAEGSDGVIKAVYDKAIRRPSFWAFNASELLIGVLSIVAGWWLAIRPRDRGRKLAIARALVVILALPIATYEQFVIMDDSMQATMASVNASLERSGQTPPGDFADTMDTLMRGTSYGTIIVITVIVLVINGLLIFFMTRPGIREYLKQREEGGHDLLPHYDATLGLPAGSPPEKHKHTE